MSELKEFTASEIEEYDDARLELAEDGKIDCTRVYIKSEADKVIAELKRQIEFLKVTANSCKNCAQCADGMGKVFDKEFNPLKDKLRIQKYKRCLAMAEWSDAEADVADSDGDYEDMRWYQKWYKRWLTIAEKFKEC